MKYTYLLFCALLGGVLNAQELSNHVPVLTGSVLVVDHTSIQNKLKDTPLQEQPFYEQIERELEAVVEHGRFRSELFATLSILPQNFHLSGEGKAYWYSRTRDSIRYDGYLAPVGKVDEMTVLAHDYLGENCINDAGSDYRFSFNDDNFIAWNHEMVLFADYRIPYNYYASEEGVAESLDESYYESYEERYAAEQEKKRLENRSRIFTALEEIFHPNPSLTIAESEEFQRAMKGQFDVAVYTNASNTFNPRTFNLLGFRHAKDMNEMISLFQGNYSWSYLNINVNDISFKTYSHLSERFAKKLNQTRKGKFNKKLFQYIDGSNLIGFMGLAVKPEPMYEMMMETYSTVMKSIPDYGESISNGMDVFSILLDEDELFEFIQGNAIFAVTDIKEFDVSFTRTDYDEEYNEIEVTETRKEVLPEFVFVASIGNEQLRNKIIGLYESGNILVNKGNYYQYQPFRYSYRRNRMQEEVGIYVAIKNDVLILTNDIDLVKTQLEKGVPPAQRITGSQLKLLKKNNYAGYWNGETTFGKLQNDAFGFETSVKEAMQMTQDLIGTATIEGMKKEGDLYTVKMTLKTKGEEGSVKGILSLVNMMMKTRF